MNQPGRDAIARRAVQGSPSEKTWAVALEKLAGQAGTALALAV